LLVTYHVPPTTQILNYSEGSLIQSPIVGKLHDERVNDSRFSVGQLFKLYNKDATVSFKDDTFDL
jgi:hypothetical protein